jgi:3alpha(or 20beta)-hydroxysteroid dehydrogenase
MTIDVSVNKPTPTSAEPARLGGKIIIVTGGARGVGAAVARLFVRHGARVIVTDVLEEQGRELAGELGEDVRFCLADVASSADWRRVMDVAHQFGPVSVLVNNAAILDVAKLEDSEEASYERLFRVNQLGPVLGMKAVMPDMIEARAGSIVNVGSVDAILAQDIGLTAYGGTKWALRGITKMAALELGRYGVRVNIVNADGGSMEMSEPFMPPGVIMAEAMEAHLHQILEPPRGRPRVDRIRDIANMILFLASDESAGCTAGDYPVDGGYAAGRRFT